MQQELNALQNQLDQEILAREVERAATEDATAAAIAFERATATHSARTTRNRLLKQLEESYAEIARLREQLPGGYSDPPSPLQESEEEPHVNDGDMTVCLVPGPGGEMEGGASSDESSSPENLLNVSLYEPPPDEPRV